MAVVKTQIVAVGKDSWGQVWKVLRKNGQDLVIDVRGWQGERKKVKTETWVSDVNSSGDAIHQDRSTKGQQG